MTLDDSQLLRLASDPRTRLFSEAGRSAVMAPAVTVMSLLPALAIVLSPQMDELSSRWALRALDVAASPDLRGWLEPGLGGHGKSLVYQPPLASWLLATIVYWLGTANRLCWHLLSYGASCGCIWATYRLARRLNGASFAVTVVACLCCHPLVLRLVVGATPTAMGLFFLVVAVWGFLGHLEGPPLFVSLRLLIAGVSWGLALLAIGPVALALLIPLLIHVCNLWGGAGHFRSDSSTPDRINNAWNGVRTLLVFLVTGLSFSSWWEVMMLADHGSSFCISWGTGTPSIDRTLAPLMRGRATWLSDNAWLWAWSVIGLVELIRRVVHPPSELVRRRCQLIGLWWLTALSLRIAFEILGPRESIQREAWDGFLLIPMLLIAGWGLGAVVRRETAPFVEALMIIFTVGFVVWRVTHHSILSIISGLAIFVALSVLPAIAARFRGRSQTWNEHLWRRLLQTAVVLMLVGHVAMGVGEQPRPTSDSTSLSLLQERLKSLPLADQITLVSANGIAPAPLRLMLLSRWPTAKLIVAETWDAADAHHQAPASHQSIDVVAEWSRREARQPAQRSLTHQTVPVGEPLRFGGRKLMIYTISPKPSSISAIR